MIEGRLVILWDTRGLLVSDTHKIKYFNCGFCEMLFCRRNGRKIKTDIILIIPTIARIHFKENMTERECA